MMQNIHQMKLNPKPFAQIQQGAKTVEIRLYDEKRRSLKVGDRIIFSRADDESQKIETEVVSLDVFKTFKELCCAYNPVAYGSVSADEWVDMYKYYSKEDEERFGVVGVGVRVVNP